MLVFEEFIKAHINNMIPSLMCLKLYTLTTEQKKQFRFLFPLLLHANEEQINQNKKAMRESTLHV